MSFPNLKDILAVAPNLNWQTMFVSGLVPAETARTQLIALTALFPGMDIQSIAETDPSEPGGTPNYRIFMRSLIQPSQQMAQASPEVQAKTKDDSKESKEEAASIRPKDDPVKGKLEAFRAHFKPEDLEPITNPDTKRWFATLCEPGKSLIDMEGLAEKLARSPKALSLKPGNLGRYSEPVGFFTPKGLDLPKYYVYVATSKDLRQSRTPEGRTYVLIAERDIKAFFNEKV